MPGVPWAIGKRYEARLTSGDVVLGTIKVGARVYFEADDGRHEVMSHVTLLREVE